MSRKTKSWVAAAYTTSFAMMMSLTGVIFASPATAADIVPPAQLDRCGTEQDQYVIPLNGGTSYWIGETYLEPGAYTMASGTTTVTIRATTGIQAGPWIFDYTNNGPCPAEATNTMAVDIRPCNPATGLTEVLLTYTNVADATAWYDSDLYVEAYMKEKARSEIDYVMDGSLLDGQSVTYDLADSEPSSVGGIEGLAPGTYIFKAFHSRGGLLTYEARIESCNSSFEFPESPSTPGTPDGSTGGKATAEIKPGRFVIHRACMNTQKVTGLSKVRFRVERKVSSMTKLIKRPTMRAGSKACYKVKANRGSLLVVKVFNPDTKKWVRVARKKIKR